MKTIALAAALCLLFASSTLCKANSSPWCAADVAILNFKNYKGQDLARIELRSLKAVCDRNPDKKVFGVGSERSMRIDVARERLARMPSRGHEDRLDHPLIPK